MSRLDPHTVGWKLGESRIPRRIPLWVRYDRTTGVYGPQGSGKTLDLLAPALMSHPGAAMSTLTRLDDLEITYTHRSRDERPVAVLDPFGQACGLPELVWDPISGCVDPGVAERRAKAFAAGTITGSVNARGNDAAARFYAAEASKVLQGLLHAAALTGRNLEHLMEWVANLAATEEPTEILRQHPQAAKYWAGLLSGALHGAPETVSNTVATVHQALGLFFQPEIRARCVPSAGRPATDIADLIARNGTIYLLAREDPYTSASPLMTAAAEMILDTALQQATLSRYGRLTPNFLAILDELPSTAPIPTLLVRMANDRPLGLSYIYGTQSWRQLVACYGEDEAHALRAVTNNIVIFGGAKDPHFHREMSDLIDTAPVSRHTLNNGAGGLSISTSPDDQPIVRPGQIRRIPQRHALVLADNAPPIIAKLHRCIDGKIGARLLAQKKRVHERILAAHADRDDAKSRSAAAVAYAREHRIGAPIAEGEWIW